MTVAAHAKVNLTLEVLGVRPHGYHDLRSVVVPVSLADGVALEPSGDVTLAVDWSGGRGATSLPFGSEVLASTDHPIRFSPVVGARCRPPMSKITLLHPFMGKTVRIIRNPTAHCKQGGNKNEIG